MVRVDARSSDGATSIADPAAHAALLQQVVDHLPAMVAYWDRHRCNVVANAAYLEWFGFRPEEMRGVHIRRVVGEDVYAQNLPFLDAVLDGHEQLFDRTLVDTSGRTRHTQASYVPHRVDDEVVGFFVLVTDVTARVEAERALTQAASQYRALARSLPGAFVLLFDHDLRYLVADGQGLAAFGLCADLMEDRRLADVFSNHAELEPRYRAALGGETCSWDRTVGGRVFDVTAGPVHGDDGEVIAGMVIGVDVTGERRLAVTQAALHRLARASASRTPAAEVIHDLVVTLLELFSAGYVGVTRFDADAIRLVATAPPLPEGIGPTVPHDGRSATSRVLATGRPALVRIDPDLGHSPLLDALGASTAAAVPIHVDGRLWGALSVGLPGAPTELDHGIDALSDFAELVALAIGNSEAWDELQHRSTTDPLTGLANRRTFEDQLAAAIDRTHRTGSPLSVAIIDLDHFKEVNDRHGHGVGDEVLAEAARRLAAACRPDELVARLGGEEFAVVLPAAADAALVGIERLRTAIRGGTYPDGLDVAASAGCASASGPGTDASRLLRRADAALYRAKAGGRDRTVVDAD